MTHPGQPSPAEWFAKAAQCYIDGHQACVACGGRHCVFRTETADLVEFYCYSCDFSVCNDRRTGRHHVWDQCAARPQVPSVLAALSGL